MHVLSCAILILLLVSCAPSHTHARLRMRGSSPLAALLPLTIPAAPAPTDLCDGDDYGTAGQFDLYVLAQSWSAEFCYPSSHHHYPGCQQPTDWQRVNLTLHGLWPQYVNDTDGHAWPQCCNSTYGSELNDSVVTGELAQLQLYWPNEQAPDGTPVSSTLWAHEWAKHGTCSDVAQLEYVQQGLALMQLLPTPDALTQHIGSHVTTAKLEAAYNGGQACSDDSCMVGLQCDNGYLTEVHTCWDKQLQQVVCPSLVMSDSGRCTGSEVKISKFA